MNARMDIKTVMNRTAALFLMMAMLFAALPVRQAGATSLNITSIASGTWEATAWPNTLRSGTITVTAGNQTVVGTGTAFTTELSVGNILRNTGNVQIGTVASITNNTHLTLANIPATTRNNIAYHVQGVGPADNVTIANTHTVKIAANPVNQAGTVTVNAGGTLTVVNAATIFSTLTVFGTVNTTKGNDFGTLVVRNGGVVDAAGTGATTAYTASSLTINSGGTFNISRNFTVSGATSMAGTINFSSTSVTSRAMVFMGPVILNNGAAWNEATSGNGSNNTYNFQNNLTNNASSFTTSNTAVHTFSGAGKTISGVTNTSIAKVRVTGTYTNNGILTVGSALSGAGTLTNGASGTLNLGGNVSINTLANEGTLAKTGAGPISTALANFTNTGTLNLNTTGTITGITNNAGGIVNLYGSGLINAFDNATATSVLNVFDLTPVPHFTTLTVSAPGNTVNYSGNGDQTVKPIIYSNLIFSGSGNKSITMPNGSTLTSGNLSIAPTGTAKASITGPNLSVNSLALGGFGKINGTWGSTSSVAANTDDNFFAPTTGYLNVATDSRATQTIEFTSTAPTNAEVGETYTPTASATSGLPVTLAIDPSSSAVCSMSAGEVTFNANGACIINANQAGDANYQAAPQAQQSIEVKTNQTINFTSTAPTDAEVGGPTYTPTATATSGLPVVFTIDAAAASVCSINAGEVSFIGTGTCVINANQPGDASFHPAPQVQQSFAVTSPEATVSVFAAQQEVTGSPILLAQGLSTRKAFAINKGPLKLQGDLDILASQRVIYKVSGKPTSFSEMMGLPNSTLDTVYLLPWYTSNQQMNTQLQLVNVSNAVAHVQVIIGGVRMTGSPFTIPVNGNLRKSFPGVNKGPVRIVSDQNIVASERVIYKANGVVTSFSEMMALPKNQLDNIYWMPWYTNNRNLNTELRIANVTSTAATIHVSIGGVEVSSFPLAARTSVRKTFAGIDKGPVKIESDQNIVASERMIYKVNGVPVSFSETMALPDGQLETAYWLPWYTSNPQINTQLRVLNVSNTEAHVHVIIGNVEVAGSPFTIPVNGSLRRNFAGMDKGPVKIVSDQNVIASERVVYLLNGKPTSFSEMLALPDSLKDLIVWFPWNSNNVNISTQIRLTVP